MTLALAGEEATDAFLVVRAQRGSSLFRLAVRSLEYLLGVWEGLRVTRCCGTSCGGVGSMYEVHRDSVGKAFAVVCRDRKLRLLRGRPEVSGLLLKGY